MVMSKRQITASDGELSPSSNNQDDGLSALQLPFLQTHEMSKFLNSSKDWVADGGQELDLMDDVESFSSNFQGHYPNVTSLYTADIGMGSQLVSDYQGHSIPFDNHVQSHFGHSFDTSGQNQRAILSPFPRSSSSLYYGGQMGSILPHGSTEHSKISSPGFPDGYDPTGLPYLENSPMQSSLGTRRSNNTLAYIQQLKAFPSHQGFDHEVHDSQFVNPNDSLGPRDLHSVTTFNGDGRPQLSNEPGIKTSPERYPTPPHMSVVSGLNLDHQNALNDSFLSNNGPNALGSKKMRNVRYNFDRPAQRKRGAVSSNVARGTSVSSRLLSFLPCFKETMLFDGRGNPVEVVLTSSLSGNFFLSETSPPDEKGEGNEEDEDVDENEAPVENSQKSPQSDDVPGAEDGTVQDSMRYELTFYRRNLFQVTATVSNAHNAAYAGNVENPEQRSRILSLSLGVTVLGSQDKKEKQLIYCAPKVTNEGGRKDSKGDAKNESNYHNKQAEEVSESPSIKFIEPTASGYDDVVSWKRLQFRAATSHNGHKKSQHFFCVCVSVFAELENAQRVCILTSYSRPIVVRGRNPRFYQNRNNIVISEIDENENISAAVSLLMAEYNTYRDFIMKRVNMSLNSLPPQRNQDSRSKESSDAAYRIMEAHNKRKPIPGQAKPLGSKAQTGNKGRRPSRNIADAKQAVSVKTENASNDMNGQKSSKKTMNERQAYYQEHYIASSVTTNADSAKSGTKDEDYEYFPMPVNYWLPPVEVVYRPHVVHHPVQLPKTSTRTGFDPNKRYFSTVE